MSLEKDDLVNIFMPTLNVALQRFVSEGVKLSHYTSFEVAKKIIEGRSVWMRNARAMNDVGEIQHGIKATDIFMASDANKARLHEVLNPFSEDFVQKLEAGWLNLKQNIVPEVFISCFSEHWPDEDGFGRLSMWRAYCAKPDGVALILNTDPFRLESNALNAYSSPVFYGSSDDYAERFHDVLNNIETNSDQLKVSGSDLVFTWLSLAILYGALCLKHPGFQEEEEWRIIHMPNINLPSLLQRINIDGVSPETVYAIPLKNAPEQGLVGIEINELLDKIIIGPTNRSALIRKELESLLADAGVETPGDRIVESGIPLRVNT